MRRGCLFGILGLFGLCIIGCALTYFVALPRVRDAVRDPFEEVIGTQVALVAAPTPGVAPEPGTYVLDAADLNTAIRDRLGDNGSFDNVAVTLTEAGFQLRLTTNDQDVTYEGNMAAVNGRLDVTNVSGDGWLTSILPAGEIAESIESVVNDYLTANNLVLSEAVLGDGTLTLTTERA
jgi:hypothetical protein